MSRIPVQMHRMSAADLAAYKGPIGEQIFNTDTKRTHFQDGATLGGWPTRLLSDGTAGEVLFNAAQTLTDDQKAQVQTNIGVIGNRDGCCRLFATDYRTIGLYQYGGERLVINGRSYVIPAGGVFWQVGSTAPASSGSILTGQSLTAGTTYYVYAFIDASGVMQLELSSVTRATDSAGRQIKNGDATRRLVAQVRYSGSSSFSTVYGQVQNWFNREPMVGQASLSLVNTTSTSDTQFGAGVGYLAWAGDIVEWETTGYGVNNTAGLYTLSKIYTDAVTIGTQQVVSSECVGTSSTANAYAPLSNFAAGGVSQDGWHGSYIGGRVSGGQGTFVMNNFVKTRG